MTLHSIFANHQPMRWWATGIILASIAGCSDTITANSLGVDKVATNQCLTADQITNEGIVIPRGTKGYMQENLGRESFVITNRLTGLPIAYDITGQQKLMAGCSGGSVDPITTAGINRPVQQQIRRSVYPVQPPIPPMPVQPYPAQPGYGGQTIYQQTTGYPAQ
ncbi:hypothetical protein [Cohaesibacter gelatinilyticus]|nr:hypothetical protein [Cohaesibacter gelatinilyticus]